MPILKDFVQFYLQGKKINKMLKERIMKDIQNNKIRQGYLQKRSKYLKQWRQRWIVLTFNFLISFKTKECKDISDIIEVSNIENYKSYINNTQEMVMSAFKIKGKDNLMYLIAKDQQQKWSWIVSLQRLLDYRANGATKYNNLTYIKTAGFKSLVEHQSGKDYLSVSQQTDQLQFQGTNAKDQQTLIMMKQIFKKQEQLKKQKQLIRKQKKVLKKQIQQFQIIRSKNPQLTNFTTISNKKISFNTSFSTINHNQQLKSIRQQDEQDIQFEEVIRRQTQKMINNKDIKTKQNQITKTLPGRLKNMQNVSLVISQSIVSHKQPSPLINPEQNLVNKNIRQSIVYGILEQFTPQSLIIFGLKYFVEFLASLCTDDKFGYSQLIFTQLKTHKNNQFFFQILVQISQSYDSYESFNIISIFFKRIFEQKIKIQQSYYPILLKNVIKILFTIDNQSREQLVDLLNIIFQLSKLMKIEQEEQLIKKLNKFTRLSKKEEIRNLSKNIIGMVKC